MDPKRIDDLAREVGSGQSRRRILKTLASGAVAAMSAVLSIDSAAAARSKRAAGGVCSKNVDCQSGLCLPRDRTGRRVCAGCDPVKECPAGDLCQTATCDNGVCGFDVHHFKDCAPLSICTYDATCQVLQIFAYVSGLTGPFAVEFYIDMASPYHVYNIEILIGNADGRDPFLFGQKYHSPRPGSTRINVEPTGSVFEELGPDDFIYLSVGIGLVLGAEPRVESQRWTAADLLAQMVDG